MAQNNVNCLTIRTFSPSIPKKDRLIPNIPIYIFSIYNCLIHLNYYETKILFEIFIAILFRNKHVLTICQQSILSTPFTENYVLSCATTKNHYILSLTKILKRCKGEEYHMCFFARKYVIVRFLSKWKELDWKDINVLLTLW